MLLQGRNANSTPLIYADFFHVVLFQIGTTNEIIACGWLYAEGADLDGLFIEVENQRESGAINYYDDDLCYDDDD